MSDEAEKIEQPTEKCYDSMKFYNIIGEFFFKIFEFRNLSKEDMDKLASLKPNSLSYFGKTKDGKGYICPRNLAMTFTVEGNQFRVLGINPSRMEAIDVVEYEVYRIPGTFNLATKFKEKIEIKEQMTESKRQMIMRICYSNIEQHLETFNREKEIVKLMRKIYRGNKRIYDHFPRFFAEGQFEHLIVTPERNRPDITFKYVPPTPTPFFIYEKIGPSLEALFNCSSNEDPCLSPNLAVFVAIGCIRALRHLHQLGMMYCDVQPCRFAIRLGPSGKLIRAESDVINRIVLTHFGCTRNWRQQCRQFGVQTGHRYQGTLKYCSSSQMRGHEACPADDLVSLMYMMLEFMQGSLSWADYSEKAKKVDDFDVILKKKEALEVLTNIEHPKKEERDRKERLLFADFNKVMALINEGYKTMNIDYMAVIKALLTGINEYHDKDKIRSPFSFQLGQLITYRYGSMDNRDMPLMPADAKTMETDEMAAKADYIFPVSQDQNPFKNLIRINEKVEEEENKDEPSPPV